MLSQRLRELVDAGVVAHEADARGGSEYQLTAAGQALKPIIEQLGMWGQRWANHQLTESDLDPAFLMWAFHRHVRHKALPDERVVVLVEFPEQRASLRRWWVIAERGNADLCLKRPGFDVDVTVTTDVATLTMVYLGRVEVATAVRTRKIVVSGSRGLVRSFARWCARSRFADVASPERPSI
jgi:hypothetical protein